MSSPAASVGAKPSPKPAAADVPFDAARWQGYFAKLDVNHDGTVSKEELKQVIKDLKLPFSKGDAGRILRTIDKDGNGTIDFEVRNPQCFSYQVVFS